MTDRNDKVPAINLQLQLYITRAVYLSADLLLESIFWIFLSMRIPSHARLPNWMTLEHLLAQTNKVRSA